MRSEWSEASSWRDASASTRRPPSLVGRGEQLRLAAAALQRDGVVIGGPHGAGRSRMARELAAIARASGRCVDWVATSRSAAGIPLAALSGLLADGREGPPRTVGEAVAALATRSEKTREWVLACDDAHLLDVESAVVMRQFATRGKVSLLLTVCDEEECPEPVTALWRDELLARVDVPQLSKDLVSALLCDVLGAPLDGISLERIYRLCEGNLVYLRELVAAVDRDGGLERIGTAWRWNGPVSPSARLDELVWSRLAALAPAERTVLELLAWGEGLGAQLLRELAPGADLVAMESKGLIRVRGDGQRRPAGPARLLDTEVLRNRTPQLRADQICRTLAEAVEAKGARRADDRLAIALWHLTAGGGANIPVAVYLSAARSAHATIDPGLAERLARAAVHAAPASLAAGLLLAETLAWQGRHAEAAEAISGLDDIARSDADVTQLALTRAVTACWGRDEPCVAVEELLRAESRVTSAELRQELQAMRAGVHYAAGQAPAVVEAAADLMRAPSSPANLVRMHRAAVPALALTGRIEQALVEWDRCRCAAETIKGAVPEAVIGLPLAGAAALRAASRLAEADQLAAKVYRDASGSGVHFAAGAGAQMLGMIALDAGRVADARRWLGEAVTLLGSADLVGFLSLSWSSLARAHALSPDPDRDPPRPMAVEAAAAQLAAEKALSASRRSWAPQVEVGRAWVALAEGRHTEARALALEAAEAAAAVGFHTVALNAAHDALRLGARRSAHALLVQEADLVDGPLTAVYLEHALALEEQDGGRLDAVSRAFAALGCRLLAAEAATEAAAAHRCQGLPARSSASAACAAGHLATCQGALSPVIAEHGTATGLTAREREVAKLAAEGLSNREIAHHLGTSVRTVESHLAHVYSKLGVTRREQLTGLLA
ncbi:LuxR family transcriptional regulator [Actinocrinis sp.]|uniref:helix-turn-helix transcriptional regulator n=1 Tax=Actinocrinis sp. TaxID=1920516 RepID=UPI002B79B1EB|nr:LuxR family transcriptional regulator [Actinocrinis sp.]HXR73540.1 LuxR family transcriptional regulator [Actinocrinis sp.]